MYKINFSVWRKIQFFTVGICCGVIFFACGENCLKIDIEELWRGYYGDVGFFLGSVEEKGPEIEVNDYTLSIRWNAMVYEDCRKPEGFCYKRNGQELFFSIEDLKEDNTYCMDLNVVANITASKFIWPGKYIVHVSCNVDGYYFHNVKNETFEIEVK